MNKDIEILVEEIIPKIKDLTPKQFEEFSYNLRSAYYVTHPEALKEILLSIRKEKLEDIKNIVT